MFDNSPTTHFHLGLKQRIPGVALDLSPQEYTPKRHSGITPPSPIFQPVFGTFPAEMDSTPKRPAVSRGKDDPKQRGGRRSSATSLKRGEMRTYNGRRQKWNGHQWRYICKFSLPGSNDTLCNRETQRTTEYCSRHLSSMNRAGLQGQIPPAQLQTPEASHPHRPQQHQFSQNHVNFSSPPDRVDEDSQDSVFSANRPKLEKDRSFSVSSVSDGSSMSPGMPELVAAEGLMSLSNSRTNTPYTRTPLDSLNGESPELGKMRKKRLFEREDRNGADIPDEPVNRSLTSSLPAQVERMDYSDRPETEEDDIPEDLVCTEDCLVEDLPPARDHDSLSSSVSMSHAAQQGLFKYKCRDTYSGLPNGPIVKVPTAKRRKIDRDIAIRHRSSSLPNLASNVFTFVFQDSQVAGGSGSSVVSPVRFTEKPQEKMHQPKVQTKELTGNAGSIQDSVFYTSSHQPLLKSHTSAFDTLQSSLLPDSKLSDGEGSSTNMMSRLSLHTSISTPSTQSTLTPPPSATLNGKKHYDPASMFHNQAVTPEQGTAMGSPFSYHPMSSADRKVGKSGKKRKGKLQEIRRPPSPQQLTPPPTHKKIQR